MFEIGECIVYGTNGVCRVSEIRNSPFDEADTRLYYVLTPMYDTSSLVIYTPVENTNVVMRPLITKDQALELIARMPFIGLVEVPVEKKRRDTYRELVQTAKLENYVSVIKTVSARRAEFRRTRRRLPDLDNDFEHTSRNCLYGELAEALGISREEVHNRICGIIGE